MNWSDATGKIRSQEIGSSFYVPVWNKDGYDLIGKLSPQKLLRMQSFPIILFTNVHTKFAFNFFPKINFLWKISVSKPKSSS